MTSCSGNLHGNNASGSGEIQNAASDFRTDVDNASQNEESTGECDVIDDFVIDEVCNDFSATKNQRTTLMLLDGLVAQNDHTAQHSGRNSDMVLRDSSETMGLFLNASALGTGAALMEDKRELSNEKKRQSNRESAKLRKQQEEVNHLQLMVKELKAVSSMLKKELLHLCEECSKLRDENDSILEELKRIGGEDAVSSHEALISDKKVNGEN